MLSINAASCYLHVFLRSVTLRYCFTQQDPNLSSDYLGSKQIHSLGKYPSESWRLLSDLTFLLPEPYTKELSRYQGSSRAHVFCVAASFLLPFHCSYGFYSKR